MAGADLLCAVYSRKPVCSTPREESIQRPVGYHSVAAKKALAWLAWSGEF